MSNGECFHCGERESGGEVGDRSPESNEEGVLCDECRDEMWRDSHSDDGL